jgi:hypothetical protein
LSSALAIKTSWLHFGQAIGVLLLIASSPPSSGCYMTPTGIHISPYCRS